MGIYLNPGKERFQESLASQIYVDKSGLIAYTNRVLGTEQKFVCVSRPRRFGKSMAANMLAAYYGRTYDASALFDSLEIAGTDDYRKHLNQYDVIFLNIQKFLSKTHDVLNMEQLIEKSILWDLLEKYPDCRFFDKEDLTRTLMDVYHYTKIPFVFILDEWDCIFRENQNDHEAQKIYLDFLRNLLKDAEYVKLAYMTGILPVKKYGSHSALNMFYEFSMTEPR
ncbi:MAG: AAA family ATPase [Lachnospiraceae bacterium]|nr:AAA family ATPase [Lachnospiraceae bacterium]